MNAFLINLKIQQWRGMQSQVLQGAGVSGAFPLHGL